MAELFDNHFIQAAHYVVQIYDSDYGQDFESHLSIIAIHQHYRDVTDTSLLIFAVPTVGRLRNHAKKFM